ncbi:MAG: hypothetical protein R3D71_06820 [Rickettsiales bacterium]
MNNTTSSFEELIIPRKDIGISSGVIYRVYKDRTNFKVVEALSALDAIAQSKVKNPYKVERTDKMANSIIQLNQVFDIEDDDMEIGKGAEDNIAEHNAQEVNVEATEDIVEEQQSEIVSESSEVAVVPDENAPLNNDDVERLLNN